MLGQSGSPTTPLVGLRCELYQGAEGVLGRLVLVAPSPLSREHEYPGQALVLVDRLFRAALSLPEAVQHGTPQSDQAPLAFAEAQVSQLPYQRHSQTRCIIQDLFLAVVGASSVVTGFQCDRALSMLKIKHELVIGWPARPASIGSSRSVCCRHCAPLLNIGAIHEQS